jgi:hypothetical protein
MGHKDANPVRNGESLRAVVAATLLMLQAGVGNTATTVETRATGDTMLCEDRFGCLEPGWIAHVNKRCDGRSRCGLD